MPSTKESLNHRYIRYIELAHYRCFGTPEKQTIGRFERFNLIFGSNGSGKTSFLESIELAILRKTSRLQDKNCLETQGIVKTTSEANPPRCKLLDDNHGELFSFPQSDEERHEHFRKMQLYESYNLSAAEDTNQADDDDKIGPILNRLRGIIDRVHFLNFETTIRFLEASNNEKLLDSVFSSLFGNDVYENWKKIERANVLFRNAIINRIVSHPQETSPDELINKILLMIDNQIVNYIEKKNTLSLTQEIMRDTESNLHELFQNNELQRITVVANNGSGDQDTTDIINERISRYEEVLALLREYPTPVDEEKNAAEQKRIEQDIQASDDKRKQYDLRRYLENLKKDKIYFDTTKVRVSEKLSKLNVTLNPLDNYAMEIVGWCISALQSLRNTNSITCNDAPPQNAEELFQSQLSGLLEKIGDLENILISQEEELLESKETIKEEYQLDVDDMKIMPLLEEWHKIRILRRIEEHDDKYEEYTTHFFNRLSRIFVMLHHPSDFSGIQLNRNHKGKEDTKSEKNTLEVRVKNIKKDVWADAAHVISAGQRSALAISIIFALNSQYANGLPYLVLDEPLHNLDQLTLLSCLDLLRGFMERYPEKQIFLSTADKEVQGMVRHKFRYLGNDFQDFEFSRVPGQESKFRSV